MSAIHSNMRICKYISETSSSVSHHNPESYSTGARHKTLRLPPQNYPMITDLWPHLIFMWPGTSQHVAVQPVSLCQLSHWPPDTQWCHLCGELSTFLWTRGKIINFSIYHIYFRFVCNNCYFQVFNSCYKPVQRKNIVITLSGHILSRLLIVTWKDT